MGLPLDRGPAMLLIVGAGGFGREILQYALDAGLVTSVDEVGFLDDSMSALKSIAGVARPEGPVLDHVVRERAHYLIAIGEPRIRADIATRLMGAQFATLIHPRAYVAPTAVINPGCLITPGAVVGPGARLATGVVVNVMASIGHDAEIGPQTVFSPYATCNGGARLGATVFLGTRATILPSVEVGEGAKVAAGAVVYRHVPAGAFVHGDPARVRVMPRGDG